MINISEFVIYPPAAEAQYVTFDSVNAKKKNCLANFLCRLPITLGFVINSIRSNVLNTILNLELRNMSH